MNFSDFNNLFFIGVAGTGMSALAQYCKGIGKIVSGSDRYFSTSSNNDIEDKLTQYGIQCFAQDGSGINHNTQLIITSTAVEDNNIEILKAKELNIPIIKRSKLLTLISETKKTIAVGGTSGKSTTSAMIFEILNYAGLKPSIISGAGLTRLQKQNLIGNAFVGDGDWLVIEADESDGSIVNYKPEIGLLLNIDKDHKEIDELNEIFTIFKQNSKTFVTNQSHILTKPFSQNIKNDFALDINLNVGFVATNFEQKGFEMSFSINDVLFKLNQFGAHNMENALAATTIASLCGINIETCAKALFKYEGIYRRNQILGKKNGIWVIDDYAHNPAKCAAAIKGVQPISNKVIAWFQPHGYGPTKFLRNDFVQELSKALRPQDEIWMSEIFYAGGTAQKDISANDLINDLKNINCKAFFVENRNSLVANIKTHLQENCVLLLMGARDPTLDDFAKKVFNDL